MATLAPTAGPILHRWSGPDGKRVIGRARGMAAATIGREPRTALKPGSTTSPSATRCMAFFKSRPDFRRGPVLPGEHGWPRRKRPGRPGWLALDPKTGKHRVALRLRVLSNRWRASPPPEASVFTGDQEGLRDLRSDGPELERSCGAFQGRGGQHHRAAPSLTRWTARPIYLDRRRPIDADTSALPKNETCFSSHASWDFDVRAVQTDVLIQSPRGLVPESESD